MRALIAAGRQSPRTTALERAMYALARAQTMPHRGDPEEIARATYPDDDLVAEIVQRGAAPLGTTTGAGFAAELVPNLVSEFVSTLAPLSAAARIIGQGLQVPIGSAASQKIPAREGGPSTTVAWVGEGEPIPVRSYALNDDCELAPRKFGFIIAISREAAKRANGEQVVRQLIREDAAASLDAAYFSNAAGDDVTHAGMLNGITALSGYAGGDREAMETDLAALSDAVTAAGSGQVAYVVSPKRAARIRVRAPDLNRELTFLPSLAVADTTIIAVDPLSWTHGFGDDFDLDVARDAVLHMNDDPAEIVSGDSPAATADPVRSLWQTDCLALRFLSNTAFAARRSGAAAWLQEATW